VIVVLFGQLRLDGTMLDLVSAAEGRGLRTVLGHNTPDCSLSASEPSAFNRRQASARLALLYGGFIQAAYTMSDPKTLMPPP
jgi:hypothetical protein